VFGARTRWAEERDDFPQERKHDANDARMLAVGLWDDDPTQAGAETPAAGLRGAREADKFVAMSTVQEIERAIEHLPADEFFKLGEWFDDQRERLWDERITRDAQSGRLDFLIEEARAARKSGTLRPFP
jgi:hypothetical protein